MKLKIGNRFLAFICVGGLFSSLTLGALIIGGLEISETMLLRQAANTEHIVGEEARFFAQTQVKEELEEIIFLKARCIQSNMLEIRNNFSYLGTMVTSCMTNPELYKRSSLQVWGDGTRLNEMYYVPKVAGEAVPESAYQIAGLKRYVPLMGARFFMQSMIFFVASKDGWGLTMHYGQDLTTAPQQTVFGANRDWQNDIWYKAGKDSEKPVFTTLYALADGTSQVACVMPYEDADGFAGVVGVSFSPAELARDIQVKNVMADVQSLLMNQQGQIIYSTLKFEDIPEWQVDFDLRKTSEVSLAEAAERMVAGENGSMSVTVAGKDYYLVYAPVEDTGLSLGMFVPSSEVQAPVRSIHYVVSAATEEIRQELQQSMPQFRQQVLILMVVLLLVILLMGVVARYKIIRSINMLVEGVRKFAEGDFAHRITISTGDEFESLAKVFNSMADAIKRYMEKLARVTEEKTKIEASLDIAANMQQEILPRNYSSHANYDIYADMRSAKEVGGDFYDFYILGQRELIVTIADVSDKGIPAALFMMLSKTIIKNCVQNYGQKSLAAAVQKANEQIAEENGEGLFVTVFVGRLNLFTGEFVYVNAGHSLPVLCRDGENSTLPKVRNPMLGIKRGISFVENKISLQKGDTLFLYTDGVTEAMDGKQQMFGKAGMEAVLTRTASEKAREIVNAMFQAIESHGTGVEQFDDITMLALKYDGMVQAVGAIREWEVPAEADELGQVNALVREMAEELACPSRWLKQLLLVVEEIFVNIADYAYDEGGKVVIRGRLLANPSAIELSFIDEGYPYNPLTKSDPDFTIPLQQRREGGLGVFLIRKYVEDVSYKWQDGRNILTIYKKIT